MWRTDRDQNILEVVQREKKIAGSNTRCSWVFLLLVDRSTTFWSVYITGCGHKQGSYIIETENQMSVFRLWYIHYLTWEHPLWYICPNSSLLWLFQTKTFFHRLTPGHFFRYNFMKTLQNPELRKVSRNLSPLLGKKRRMKSRRKNRHIYSRFANIILLLSYLVLCYTYFLRTYLRCIRAGILLCQFHVKLYS